MADPSFASSTEDPLIPSTSSQPMDSVDPTFEIDPDVDMAIGTNPMPESSGPNATELPPEPRIPTRKDISLREFLAKMDDYAPIIPDAVTQHHLLLAGLPPNSTPLPLARLLALATQKFIADIAADAYQYSRMRSSASGSSAPTAATTIAGGIPGTQATQSQQQQQEKEKGKAGAHVLGVQRAGYGGGGGGGGQGRAVLTMEDLGCAVGEYGVNVKRGEFYR